MSEYKTIESKEIFAGRIVNLRVDKVRLPDGNIVERELIHHSGGAGIVALNSEGKIAMVRQFRDALRKDLLEIPAGKLDSGEDPLTCAKRELEEETALVADKWEYFGSYYPSPGYLDEKLYIYFAEDLRPGTQHLDAEEFLSCEYYSLEELMEMVMNNEIHDGKTVIAVLKAAEYLRRR